MSFQVMIVCRNVLMCVKVGGDLWRDVNEMFTFMFPGFRCWRRVETVCQMR